MTDRVQAADQLLRQVDALYGRWEAAEERAQVEDRAIPGLIEQVRLMMLSEAALTTLLTKVSAEGLQSVEATITYGLRVVFDDHPLTFRFKADTSRGGQVLEPLLQFEGVEQPILDAFGGGPAQVVAFLLRLLVCHRLGLYPLILLDETFSMVSSRYVGNVAKLLRELAEQMNFVFVLVTHQSAFTEFATCAYEVAETADGATFRELAAFKEQQP
jgi:ABC-type glutathione transport system ATPase component